MISITKKLAFLATLTGLAAWPVAGIGGELDRSGRMEGELRGDVASRLEDNPASIRPGENKVLVPEDRGLTPRFEDNPARIGEGDENKVLVPEDRGLAPRFEDNPARVGQDDEPKILVPEDRGLRPDRPIR